MPIEFTQSPERQVAVVCPNCRNISHHESHLLGRLVDCRHCGKRITVSTGEPLSRADVMCPDCKTEVEIEVGARKPCPECGAMLRGPNPQRRLPGPDALRFVDEFRFAWVGTATQSLLVLAWLWLTLGVVLAMWQFAEGNAAAAIALLAGSPAALAIALPFRGLAVLLLAIERNTRMAAEQAKKQRES